MSASARTPEQHASHIVELVQWFEDVAHDKSRARVVTLASTNAAARLATLRAFYERLVRHPRFGRAWPATMPAGAIAPRLPARFDDTPNGLMWFGICATGEPVAEAAQLLTQFQACREFRDHDEWIYLLPYELVDGVLGAPPFESAADRADQAFGNLGDPQGTDSARMRTIVRGLDALLEQAPLLADGGVLEHDGPRLRARAMLSAAWLQRLATRTPVAVVIDEAQHASPFVTELVTQLASSAAPILIVLSGTPDGAEPFNERTGERLGGPLGALSSAPVSLLGLPADEPGALAALLAAAIPTTLFTRRHAERACTVAGLMRTPDDLLATLIDEGWFRVIDDSVFAFIDLEHLVTARDGASGVFASPLDDVSAHICQVVLAETDRLDLLERTVAARAAASW